LLVEWDNTERDANLADAVWRDPSPGFGLDVLAAHRRAASLTCPWAGSAHARTIGYGPEGSHPARVSGPRVSPCTALSGDVDVVQGELAVEGSAAHAEPVCRLTHGDLAAGEDAKDLIPLEGLDARQPTGGTGQDLWRKMSDVYAVGVRGGAAYDVGEFADVAWPGVVLESAEGMGRELDLATTHAVRDMAGERDDVVVAFTEWGEVHDGVDDRGERGWDVLEAFGSEGDRQVGRAGPVDDQVSEELGGPQWEVVDVPDDHRGVGLADLGCPEIEPGLDVLRGGGARGQDPRRRRVRTFGLGEQRGPTGARLTDSGDHTAAVERPPSLGQG